jgi:hypothetical protein
LSAFAVPAEDTDSEASRHFLAGRQAQSSGGSFVVAAIPAARSFAIRLMSFTGTGLASGK